MISQGRKKTPLSVTLKITEEPFLRLKIARIGAGTPENLALGDQGTQGELRNLAPGHNIPGPLARVRDRKTGAEFPGDDQGERLARHRACGVPGKREGLKVEAASQLRRGREPRRFGARRGAGRRFNGGVPERTRKRILNSN